jgi:hypothetical protein
MINPVISDDELASIDKPELLAIVQSLRDELAFKQKVIDKITHEMAVLKRLKFASTSEHFSTTRRASLRLSGTCEANGPARIARPWCRRRWRHT